MTPELKPCPFCGAEPVWTEDGRPLCGNCLAKSPSHRQWNRRTPDLTEALARLKALEEELKYCARLGEQGAAIRAKEIAAIREKLGASDAL